PRLPLGALLARHLVAPFLGSSTRAASLLGRGSTPGCAARAADAGAGLGSTFGARDPAGAVGDEGFALSRRLGGRCSADGRNTSGTSPGPRRGRGSAGGR